MQIPSWLVMGLRILLALTCASIGSANMGSGMSFPIALGFFGVAALLVAHPIANAIAGALVGNGLGNRGPEIACLSRARSLIVNREYHDAKIELERMLAAKPDLIAARLMLLRLLYENLHDAKGALAAAEVELADGTWRAEEEQIAGLAVDILLEQGRRAEAVALLQRVLPKARGSAAEAGLRDRLQALSQR